MKKRTRVISLVLFILISALIFLVKPVIVINNKVYFTFSQSIDIFISSCNQNFNSKEYERLQYAKNLKKLSIHDPDIKDISFLKHVQLVEEFDFLGSNYENFDYSPIRNLTKLKIFYGVSFIANDLSAFEFSTNLESLCIEYSTVSDISSLKKLTNLKYLSLQSENISDISSLKESSNMLVLKLYNTSISDISCLKGLKQLQIFKISNSYVDDISVLSYMPNLEKLSIDGTNVTDVSVLFKLKNLKELYVSKDQLSSDDISKLEGMGVEVKYVDF